MDEYPDFVVEKALNLLDSLSSRTFNYCAPLSRKFDELPPRPGIYAFRQRDAGILYIGKSTNIRARLRGGHKALGWAFIDRLDPDDVRIAFTTLSFQWNRVSYQLEQVMIGQTQPPYNDR
ncbi:GIY-YIG nuclease family protein [Egbenema bharatensis]|uniref:GIY-YIG nuclease family protein n=1 Tax=Egbenema bharatensis TaxID=3463334 RepID=UPI003A860504